MGKRRTIVEKQSYGYLTFWQRLLLVGTILLSGEIVAGIIPSQSVHAINCRAGNGNPGGVANGGQGSIEAPGGDCIIGGKKEFIGGGFDQNNGVQRGSQTDGGGNLL